MKEYDFYIIPTPIGNLGDISKRAIDTLKSVDIIACEDMRVTQKLLNHFDIKTKCISYHKFNEKERVAYFLDLLQSGKTMALVSDAGTPLFCDPGAILVKELRKHNVKITALAGANAVATFLSQISRDNEDFVFTGFLPKTKTQIGNLLSKYKSTDIVFYDSPNRILNTLETKKNIAKKYILEYFKKISLLDITALTIRAWQNEILKLNLSETFCRAINNQLSSVMNYAVKYYNLQSNPVRQAGGIGKRNANEMKIWTVEEFNKFAECIKEKFMYYVAFKILFWTGMRIGELLALTVEDFNIKKQTLRINKNYQVLKGVEMITTPKTIKSIRVLEIDDELASELNMYIKMIYLADNSTRLFPFTRSSFSRILKVYAQKAEIKQIRVHDLRHSHASLLLHEGMDIASVARRLGHENVETTLKTYTHIYNTRGGQVTSFLNKIKGGIDD